MPTPSRTLLTGRRNLSLFVLITMAAIGVVLCALVAAPFVSALTWAFALAVVADPLHRALLRRLRFPNIAAAVSVLLVTLVLLIPTTFIGWQLGTQATERSGELERYLKSGKLGRVADRIPGGRAVYERVIGTTPEPADLVPVAQGQTGDWLQSVASAGLQFLVALFALFFLLRDRNAMLAAVRGYTPMSNAEADYFFERIRSMTHATLYGNVVTSIIQGVLGGLMFALLGIPSALLWGAAMALLSVVPSAGAFLIWIPAAVVLVAHGQWGKAAILASWGTVVVGSIDNLLYPALVGREIRLHTLPVFLSVIGGLIVFGASGLVLGPVILAGTIAMLDILRRRTARSRSALETQQLEVTASAR